MADDITQTDDWDIDEMLKEFEPEVEEAEHKADDQVAKVAKSVRKLAERQAKNEEQARIDKAVAEFYEKASEAERELADVLLAGVSDEKKVKNMIDLAKAKAKAMSKSEEEVAEDAEEKDTGEAFAAPPQPYHQPPSDPWEPVLERARAGDVHASFLEFMADSDGFPGQVKRR